MDFLVRQPITVVWANSFAQSFWAKYRCIFLPTDSFGLTLKANEQWSSDRGRISHLRFDNLYFSFHSVPMNLFIHTQHFKSNSRNSSRISQTRGWSASDEMGQVTRHLFLVIERGNYVRPSFDVSTVRLSKHSHVIVRCHPT